MLERYYIQVILPLRLKWEPWYYCEVPVEAGTRVRVRNSGREYIGVVSSTGGSPDIDENRILKIISVETELERILPSEMEFWHFIADYYLCSVGEVYKYAYPAGESRTEVKSSRKKIDLRRNNSFTPALQLENCSRPIFVSGAKRSAIYEKHIEKALSEGRDVLLISPDKPRESYATRREYAKAVRSDTPIVIEGNKSNIFLPFTKLGLVIIDDEDSVSFKNNGAAPRFNGRDAAIMLASMHGASVLLGSLTPSLETVLNVNSGKYKHIETEAPTLAECEIIDTDAEFRKNGMVGDRSRKLIAAEEEVTARGGKFTEINSWELGKAFKTKLEKYDLVAVLHAELMSSRADFRADEKYSHAIFRLRSRCRGRIMIQTRVSERSVVPDQDLLKERKEFNFPPFSRLVEIRKRDEETVVRQYFLKKDKYLGEKKKEIAGNIPGDCFIDVDPL